MPNHSVASCTHGVATIVATLSVGRTERSMRAPPSGHIGMMLKNWMGQTSYGRTQGDAPMQKKNHPMEMAPNCVAKATLEAASFAAVSEPDAEASESEVVERIVARLSHTMRALVSARGNRATKKRPMTATMALIWAEQLCLNAATSSINFADFTDFIEPPRKRGHS